MPLNRQRRLHVEPGTPWQHDSISPDGTRSRTSYIALIQEENTYFVRQLLMAGFSSRCFTRDSDQFIISRAVLVKPSRSWLVAWSERRRRFLFHNCWFFHELSDPAFIRHSIGGSFCGAGLSENILRRVVFRCLAFRPVDLVCRQSCEGWIFIGVICMRLFLLKLFIHGFIFSCRSMVHYRNCFEW